MLSRLLGALLTLACVCASADTTQQHVHDTAHAVMPFDMSKTTHVFKMTPRGGIQSVLVKDISDKSQVAMIQAHLRHEFDKFSRGDYADPAQLHGSGMPGLADMQANAKRIKVSYEVLPNGAMLTFDTANLEALTAIHRWFGAQLSEHGTDARAE